MTNEIVIKGPSYIGRGKSTIFFSPTEEPGLFWNDGQKIHSLVDVVKSASHPLLSMLVLESKRATILVPEHFLSAAHHRNVSGRFYVEGAIATLPKKVLGLPKNSHCFPAANADWFYERLPSGAALPRFEVVEDHTYKPHESTTIHVSPNSELSIALSWENDPKGLNPLPFETDVPKFHMAAKGITWGSILPKVIGNYFFPKVDELYHTAEAIKATPTRNSHFEHTAGSDLPGEILAILGGTLDGKITLAYNGRTNVSNHQGRLDALRELANRGVIMPAHNPFQQ